MFFLSECLCSLPWYHGSCYVNADSIVCQVLPFLIRNQRTVYIMVPVTSLHQVCSLFDVLHTQTDVCDYNYVLHSAHTDD